MNIQKLATEILATTNDEATAAAWYMYTLDNAIPLDNKRAKEYIKNKNWQGLQSYVNSEVAANIESDEAFNEFEDEINNVKKWMKNSKHQYVIHWENIKKEAESKIAADVSELDPKIQNRVKELKKVHQQIKEIQDRVNEQVGDLNKQIKTLEKQSKIFEKEIMPELKRLQDHTIKAEGILIELKSGRRSPKVGYEFLASKVTSELISAAEDAITKAAEFAQSPSIEVTSNKKTAGKFLEWITDKFRILFRWANSLTNRNNKIEAMLTDLEGV